MTPRVKSAYALAAMVILLSIVYSFTSRPGHDWGGDFSVYINHARNIAEGKPYAETRYVVTFPDAVKQMPASYPPVFPLMLAPVYKFYGLNYSALKIVTRGMFLLAACMTFVVGRIRGLPPGLAALAAFAFGSSALVLEKKEQVISDGTYLCFAGLTIVAMLLMDRWKWDEVRPLSAALLVLAPMLMAFGTRATGLALILAFSAFRLVSKRRATLYTVMVIGVFVAAAIGYGAIAHEQRSYESLFALNIKVIVINAVSYIASIATLWNDPRVVRFSIGLLVFIPAAIGFIASVRNRATVLEYYVVFSTAPLLVYLIGADGRYFLPVLAFLFIYAFEGSVKLRCMPALAVIVVGGAIFNLGVEKGPYEQGVEQASFVDVCNFIRQETRRNALIVSWNPRVLALYTDRKSAWYPETASDREMDTYLRGVDYVLLYAAHPADRDLIYPHVQTDFVRVFQNRDFSLYAHPPVFSSRK